MIRFVALASALLVSAVAAQAAPVTTASIIEMAKAKLPDDVIIAAIRNEGAAIDRSPSALIALKQAGVSDVILQAVASGASNRAPDAVQSPQMPQGYGGMGMAIGNFQRVFAFDGDKRVELQADSSGWGSNINPLSLKLVIKFSGPKSAARLQSATPRFQVSLAGSTPPLQSVSMVRLNDSPNRATPFSIRGGLMSSASLQAPKDKVIPLTVTEATDAASNSAGLRVWMFQPAAPLPPGEYAIIPMQMQYFTFGIDG